MQPVIRQLFQRQRAASLLDLLREHLQLNGAKGGCDHGQRAPAPSFSTASGSSRASLWRPWSTALPNMLKQRKYALNTHSVVLAEFDVDEAISSVTARRIVSAVAAGRIPNAKTARSQIGVKGVGECGIIGVAAAIAVHHATGKRIASCRPLWPRCCPGVGRQKADAEDPKCRALLAQSSLAMPARNGVFGDFCL